MNIQNVDRSLLKSVLIEILKEQPHLLKSVVQEIIKDKSIKNNDDLNDEELMKMIDKDFDKYDDVFRALA
ncbi:MAG: hypothetical protein ACJAT4_001041 [Granulosicoccus sp.]|jgi:hypothetical protein